MPLSAKKYIWKAILMLISHMIRKMALITIVCNVSNRALDLSNIMHQSKSKCQHAYNLYPWLSNINWYGFRQENLIPDSIFRKKKGKKKEKKRNS